MFIDSYERDMQMYTVVHSDQISVPSVFWLPRHKNYLEGKILRGGNANKQKSGKMTD